MPVEAKSATVTVTGKTITVEVVGGDEIYGPDDATVTVEKIGADRVKTPVKDPPQISRVPKTFAKIFTFPNLEDGTYQVTIKCSGVELIEVVTVPSTTFALWTHAKHVFPPLGSPEGVSDGGKTPPPPGSPSTGK